MIARKTHCPVFKQNLLQKGKINTLHVLQLVERSTSQQYLISGKFIIAVTVTPVLFPDLYGCSWLEALTGYQSPGLRG